MPPARWTVAWNGPAPEPLPRPRAGAILTGMEHVTIPLTATRQAMLKGIAAETGVTVEEYVTALIDADTRAKAAARLEALLLDGLEGEATPWTEADTARLMRLARGER
jgi:hypothetical protein